MRAGNLDRRVIIQANTPTQDGTGAAIDGWATLATVWAQRADKPGREFFASAQTIAEAATAYRIRYRSDVTAGMRIVDGNETWDIRSVGLLGGRKEALELFATRLNA